VGAIFGSLEHWIRTVGLGFVRGRYVAFDLPLVRLIRPFVRGRYVAFDLPLVRIIRLLDSVQGGLAVGVLREQV